MDLQSKELLELQAKSIKELQKAMEEGNNLSESKISELKANFLKGEEVNQKLVAEIEKQKEISNAMQDEIKSFEKRMLNIPAGKSEDINHEVKAFDKYLIDFPKQEKMFSFSEVDSKYLRTDIAANGGVLVPETLFNELIKQEVDVSPILANARVINSKTKSLTVAIRSTIPSVNRVGEGGTSSVSNSTYKSARLEAYRNDVVIPITREELNFAAFDMRTQMAEDAALALTYQTNYDFINGNGVSKSEGILTNALVPSINSGIADDITFDNLLSLQKQSSIKSTYRNAGKFYMNANTIYELAARKDGIGQYLWTSNVANGLPNTIAGRQYIDCPDMPDLGAGLYPLFFGDLKRAYYILRAIEMELVVDPYTSKKDGIIEYMWIEYLGGKVVVPEAIIKLKCQA